MTLTAVIRDANDQTIGTITLQEKQFKTGSKGYYASGKIALPNGLRAQVSCNIVVIGSKKAADASKGGKALTVAV